MLLRLADQDCLAFAALMANPDIELRIACFHGQQAVEKYIKAVLASRAIPFPASHDLLKLAALLPSPVSVLPVSLERLKRLNPFAVVFRYDDRPIATLSREEAENLVDVTRVWAHQVVSP